MKSESVLGLETVHVDRRRFQVGEWVAVRATTEVKVDGDSKRAMQTTSIPETRGRVVGVAVRFEGTLEHGGYTPDEGPESNYLSPTRRVELWEVRFGLTNRPVLVRDEDLDKALWSEECRLPVRFARQPEWTPKNRKWLSEESRSWPRDKRGRWKKGGDS